MKGPWSWMALPSPPRLAARSAGGWGTGGREPEEGPGVVDGAAVAASTRVALVRRMGYVVQDGGLYPHLTASQNVALGAEAQQGARALIDARVAELADLASFDAAMLRRYPRELSGGERPRAGLMRALMLGPPILPR